MALIGEEYDMALRPFNVIELCAGAGGLGLGIELAVPGARPVCMVEREAFAAATLVGRMEAGDLAPAPVWSDLATFDGRPWCGRVHCVASGDPCQGNSVAGKQLGADDPRFLAGPVLRIVDQVRPLRFFRENVRGNVDGQLEAFVPALERMGYRVECGIFSSGETCNSQRRERLFLMADCDGDGCARRPESNVRPVQSEQPPSRRGDIAGRDPPNFRADVGHTHDSSRDRHSTDPWRRSSERTSPERTGGGAEPPLFAPGPDQSTWQEIIASWPELEPALCRMAHAVADRVDRLRLLGNGVDPVAAAYAWLCLDARHRAHRAAAAGSASVRNVA